MHNAPKTTNTTAPARQVPVVGGVERERDRRGPVRAREDDADRGVQQHGFNTQLGGKDAHNSCATTYLLSMQRATGHGMILILL
eukprot:gene22873-biopygen10291